MNRSLFEDEDEIKQTEKFSINYFQRSNTSHWAELIFGTLYDRMGYGHICNELFRHLVITRLFNPGSKLKAIDYLLRYQDVACDISKIYLFLDNLCFRKEADRENAGDGKTDIKKQVE